MLKHLATLWLAIALSSAAIAQIQTSYRLEPASSTRVMIPLDVGGGSTLQMCERKFGWDSTHVSLLITAPDHSLIDASAFRGHSPITFLFDADALGTGYALCGSQTSAGLTYAFITHLTAAGTPDWSRSIDGIGGVGFFQDQVACLIPSGTSFMAYTKRSGLMANGSFRISGNETGTFSGGQALTAPPGIVYGIYGGIGNLVDEHFLFGIGALETSTNNQQAMLMQATLAGGAWMRFYELEMATTGSSQAEAPSLLLPANDGGFWFAGHFNTNAGTYEGWLLKLDGSGVVVWGKRYADSSGGLTIDALTELPGNRLLVAGTDAYYQIMLLELQDADGALLSARRYQSPVVAADFIQGFHVSTLGDLRLLAADKDLGISSEGASCDFVTVNSVSAAVLNPVTLTVPMSNAPFTPTTTALTTPDRSNDLSWTPTCLLSTMPEQQATQRVSAYPVPAAGFVRLIAPEGMGHSERIILRDIMGAVRFDGPYGDGVDLRSSPAGSYICEIPGLRYRVKLLRE